MIALPAVEYCAIVEKIVTGLRRRFYAQEFKEGFATVAPKEILPVVAQYESRSQGARQQHRRVVFRRHAFAHALVQRRYVIGISVRPQLPGDVGSLLADRDLRLRLLFGLGLFF